MIEAAELEQECPPATDGEIAVLNLKSAHRRSWNLFFQDPLRPGIAESIVDQELLFGQFLGDVDALDRMEMLAEQLAAADPESARTALVQAQVASTTHRFADARRHLAHAEQRGASPADVDRQLLSLDQACGAALDQVLKARRDVAASGRLEDLVPLAALLADQLQFAEADTIYRQALQAYNDVSPFPLAWVCFQLGMMWGELVPEPDEERAAAWYRRAIDYVPAYVKARVHLSEIHAGNGETAEAESLLVPVLASGDPEVPWRLADVLAAQNRVDEAAVHLAAARARWEELLGKFPLAFADHGAEFFAGSGDDAGRALELARANYANRPTRKALEQVHELGGAP